MLQFTIAGLDDEIDKVVGRPDASRPRPPQNVKFLQAL